VLEAGVQPEQIKGIGFDATCSLVVLDQHADPVSVSPTGEEEQDVIVWMDHRAMGQADRINATGHGVLQYVGGRMSPEMQAPKLLWLKENLPQTWRRAAMFLDLADFLTFQATGDDTRSLCTTVCKWAYLGQEQPEASGYDSIGRWDDSFWRGIGLGELADEGYARIGRRVRPMGEATGHGLTEASARDLGLDPGSAVGVSIIDAHAGGLGLLGASIEGVPPTPRELQRRLALIGGTSSCHMAVAPEPRFIPGVWGPYFSAMIPGMWLTEGGQSATGALIDHVVYSHARSAELRRDAEKQGRSVHELLNDRLEVLARDAEFPAALTRELHVQPDFHGNRSPRADATLRGMVSGLTLGESVDDLALLYLATIQAIAHGTRHIVETLNTHGYRIDTIIACGGGTKNPVFLREHADVTGCPIMLAEESEAVVLGAAILGAVASDEHATVLDAMTAMARAGRLITPGSVENDKLKRYHEGKYRVFHRMHGDQLAYRQLLEG
jgi:FGGY-family pentulose kinase